MELRDSEIIFFCYGFRVIEVFVPDTEAGSYSSDISTIGST